MVFNSKYCSKLKPYAKKIIPHTTVVERPLISFSSKERNYLGAISIRRKILVGISGDEWWSISRNFQKQSTTSRGTPEFITVPKLPFHLICVQRFPEFSVEWPAFQKIRNFGIFWKFPYHLFPFRNFRNSCLNRKRSIVLPFCFRSIIPRVCRYPRALQTKHKPMVSY